MVRRTNRIHVVTASDLVADNVRALRKARGISREELARLTTDAGLPMGPAAITNIETGRRQNGNRRRDVTVDELLTFASVFGVPPMALANEPTSMTLRAEADRLIRQAEALEAGTS